MVSIASCADSPLRTRRDERSEGLSITEPKFGWNSPMLQEVRRPERQLRTRPTTCATQWSEVADATQFGTSCARSMSFWPMRAGLVALALVVDSLS